jgi:hypothetical protein
MATTMHPGVALWWSIRRRQTLRPPVRGDCPAPKQSSQSCNLIVAAVCDEFATLAQRDPGIRPAPARSLIGCHGEQEIFDAGNVMDCVFLPSLDAVGETCRAFIHVSSA